VPKDKEVGKTILLILLFIILFKTSGFGLFSTTVLDPWTDVEDVSTSELNQILQTQPAFSSFCTSAGGLSNYRCTTKNWKLTFANANSDGVGSGARFESSDTGKQLLIFYESQDAAMKDAPTHTKNRFGQDILISGEESGTGNTRVFFNNAEVASFPDGLTTVEAEVSSQDPHAYIIKENGIVKREVNLGNTDTLIISFLFSHDQNTRANALEKIRLNRFAYKFPYCKLSTGEVLVYDDFSKGAVIKQDALTYQPTRYCLNVPPLIFTTNGIVDDNLGEYLVDLVEDTPNTVTDKQVRIFYIAKNITTIGTPCGINQAYNPRLKKCTAYDFDTQSTPGTSPVENGTVFVLHYPETATASLGGVGITLNPSTFTCGSAVDDVFQPGQPTNNCWKSTFTYAGTTYDTTHQSVTIVNNYTSVLYEAEGRYEHQSDERKIIGAGSKLTITVDNAFLTLTPLSQNYYVTKDTPTKIKLKIVNKLQAFPNAEVLVTQDYELLPQLHTTRTEGLNIPNGESTAEVSIDTTNLGKTTIILLPRIKITGISTDTYFTSPFNAKYTHEVITQTVTPPTNQSDPVINTSNPPTDDEEDTSSSTVFLVIAGVLLIGGTTYFLTRKTK